MLPLLTITLSDSADRTKHDQMVSLVSHMQSLHERFAEAETDHQQTILQNQIAVTDRQIDRLLYELYGLTDEEIAVVEVSIPATA